MQLNLELSNANKICYANSSNWSWIPIPKNGSQFGLKFFGEGYNMTQEINWFKDKPKDMNYLIMVRDPIKRWLSGITEFLYQENSRKERYYDLSNKQVVDLLFYGGIFDVHTFPQSFFLEGLDIDRAHFANLDDINFNLNLNYFAVRYLGYKIPKVDKLNTTSRSEHKLKIFNDIVNIYNDNQEYRDSVGYRYLSDFKMLETLSKLKKII